MTSKTTVIIGGVAGGASCAARLRRLDETRTIIMVERGPYISFANCGLPYHIGGVIEERESLIVTTEDDFNTRFKVDVRTNTEAVSINPEQRLVLLKNLLSGDVYEQSYDELVLSPGAAPVVPPFARHIERGVFTLRNIPDLDAIVNYIEDAVVEHATVIGGGFIGIEVAENLVRKGISVSLVERSPYLMPILDPELSQQLYAECDRHGVDVRVATSVVNLEEQTSGLRVHFDDDEVIETDMVILAVGVRPETSLARDAGIKLGSNKGIAVDQKMRTNRDNIYAIGDAVEVVDRTINQVIPRPLAGPANKQGRLVADIIAGRKKSYGGALGTSILKVFELNVACTGISESFAKTANIPHRVAWVHGKAHASYYPNATPLMLKVVFDPNDGRLLGGSVVGRDGVDKRIDIIATAMAAKMTVFDLEDLDLAYAPSFSSAKDPVNQVGFVASGMLRGDHPTIAWYQLNDSNDDNALIVDVRTPKEFANGHIAGAINIPLDELRESTNRLAHNKPLIIYCEEGLRGYVATRIATQLGYSPRNLLGGYKLWRTVNSSSF